MSGIAAGNIEVAAGEGSGNEEGAGLDAVGDDAMLGAFEFADAFDADGSGASAFNVGAHFIQECGEVGDFGFAGGVLQNGFAIGERRGHEQVFGSGDGDFVEDDFCAFESGGGGFNVAVFL